MSVGLVGLNGLRKGPNAKLDFEAVWAMAAKAGYTLAFEELVTRNQNRIYRLALSITQHQEDAEVLLQDTFAEARKQLQEFRGGSSFSNWLVQICIKEVLQKFREKGFNWRGLDELAPCHDDRVPNKKTSWGECPEKRYTKAELNHILSEAIRELGVVSRVVFLLRDVESFSTVEIADLLGLSVPGTRSHLLQARLAVREHLNRYFSVDISAESNCGDPTEARRVEGAKAVAQAASA